MIDTRLISFNLGFKVSEKYKKKAIKLFQPIYIDKILTKFYLAMANTSNTLIKESLLELNQKEPTTINL